MTKLRGHKIKLVNGDWVYCDTGLPTQDTHHLRPCGYCNKYNTAEDHDACLGTLPGVMNACCGHGEEQEAYVQLLDGFTVHGGDAVLIQRTLINSRK